MSQSNCTKNFLAVVSLITLLGGCTAMSGRETAGEYLDDTTITAKVKTEILKDPILEPFQIHVETFKNQVQLSGFVDSKEKARRAEKVASKVFGVRSVKNNLIVR